MLLLCSAGDFGALERKYFAVPGAGGGPSPTNPLTPSTSAPTSATKPAPTRTSRQPTSAPASEATPALSPEAVPTQVAASPAPTKSPVVDESPPVCTNSTASRMSIFIDDLIGAQCGWETT